jgi:hypothetical protein
VTRPHDRCIARVNVAPVSSSFHGLRRTKRADETGATLILALAFLVVISVIAGSVTMWVTNDLNNTAKFDSALQFESYANSGVEVALQNVRYNFAVQTLNAVPPQPCWTTSPSVSQVPLNGQSVSVWCTTNWSPLSPNTRVVTFYACLSNFSGTPTLAAMNTAATACALNPLLQAVIAFDDYPNTISASNCPPGSGGSSSTCGTTLTIQSWAFGVTPPTVSAVADPTTGTCTSPSKLVTITGTGLTGATTVNFFVPQASNNAIFSANAISGGSDTSVTVCGPSGMTAGSTYQVTVTTPDGTSVPTAVAASSLTY